MRAELADIAPKLRAAYERNEPDPEVDAWVTRVVMEAPTEQVQRLLEDVLQSRYGAPLSPREAQVLALAAEGLSRPDTAREMGITVGTVRTYRRRALSKLGANNLAHGVALWVRRGSRR